MTDLLSNEAHPSNDLTEEEIKVGLESLLAALQHAPRPLVVLIDDDDHDAFLFRSALLRTNAAVEFMRFKDGRQALDYFQGKGGFSDRNLFPLPNLTVLDFKLTRSSGLEILDYIRSSPHLAELVVVGLTASTDARTSQQAQQLSIDAYISKPDSLTALVEVVRQIKASWLDTNFS